ncbi:MAG: hypothetical protein U0269_10500 [Polyangiales bacterium]
MTKRLLTLATAGALIGLVGCGGPVNNPDGGNNPDSSTPTDGGGGGPGMTYTYVISELTVSPVPLDSNSAITGFNLDNIYSVNSEGSLPDTPRSCDRPDSPSMLDQDQNCPMGGWNMATGACGMNMRCAPGAGCRGGVDNQLPGILDAIEAAASSSFPMGIRSELTSQINQNKISLVVRVTGVNSLTDDNEVTVKVYNGYPTFTTGCDSVQPMREYAIAADSLNTASDIESAKIQFPGRIVGGRLQVTAPGMFPLPLPEIMGRSVMLTLTNAQLRVNLTATGGTGGNLGGSFNGSQLLTAIQSLAPDFAMQAATIIGGFVDIEENGICRPMPGSMNPMFGGIGVGLGFSLVPATTAAMSAPSRGAGTCGASSGSDAGGGNG